MSKHSARAAVTWLQFGLLALGLVLGAAPAQADPMPGEVDFVSLTRPAAPGGLLGLGDGASVLPFSGSFEYELPFDVPAYGGLAPKLAVHCSSAAGDGLLGPGCTVQTPMIRRAIHDGVPRYDDSDTFELVGVQGGGRLVADPASPGTYWVEAHGRRLRVTRVDSHFELVDNDGVHYVFGANGNVLASDAQHVAEWRLDSMRGVTGSEVDFSYQLLYSQIYPRAIDWGPVQGGAPVFHVDFIFEFRPNWLTNYRYRFESLTGMRLKSLMLTSFTERTRSLDFTYDSQQPGLSRLSSIQPLGRDGATGLPATRFTYADGGATTTGPSGDFNGWAPGFSFDAAWFDVDHDGYVDVLQFPGTGTCTYRRNLGFNQFAAPVQSTCPPAKLTEGRLMDVDGDGVLDFAAPSDPKGDWVYYRISPTGTFVNAGTWPGTAVLNTYPLKSVDVNGDGRADLLGIDFRTAETLVEFSSATGFGALQRLPATPGSAVDTEHLLDLNGDGLIDYQYFTTENELLTVVNYLGRGDGTFAFNSSYVLTTQSTPIDGRRLRWADFDKDGSVDYVEMIAGTFYFYRGHSDLVTFDAPVAYTNPTDSDALQNVVDLNGNGSLDLFSFSSDLRLWSVDLAGSSGAGHGPFVQTIDNGLGAWTTFEYTSTGALSRMDDIAGTPWTSHVPMVFPVVTQKRVSPGAGLADRVVKYHPADATWDGSERAFAGFTTRTTTNVGVSASDTLVSSCTYNPGFQGDRELRGSELLESRSDGNGVPIDATVFYSSAKVLPGLPDDPKLRVPSRDWIYGYAYDDGGATAIETSTYIDYDGEGRPLHQYEYGRSDIVGDERLRQWTYTVPDDVTGIRDQICATQLFDGGGNELSDLRFFFGDESLEAPDCYSGKGFLRRVLGYLDTDQRFVTLFSGSYDALGNPLQTVERDKEVNVEYDPLGVHPVHRFMRPTESTQLDWTIDDWDNVIARPLRMTGPDGVTSVLHYDGFGRVTSEAKNDLPPHIRHAYAWAGDHLSGTRPSEAIDVFDGDQSALAASKQKGHEVRFRRTVRVYSGLMEPLYESTNANAAGAGATRYLISGWKERDVLGRTSKSCEAFYSPTALPATASPDARCATTTYDALGWASVYTASNGAPTIHNYGAFRSDVTSPDRATVYSRFDGLGRLTDVERTVAGLFETANYTYDAADHVTEISLLDGAVTTGFGYDTLGRLISEYDTDHGESLSQYTDGGQLRSHQNDAAQGYWIQYDGAGRATRKGMGAVPNDDQERHLSLRLSEGRSAGGRQRDGPAGLGVRARRRAELLVRHFRQRHEYGAHGAGHPGQPQLHVQSVGAPLARELQRRILDRLWSRRRGPPDLERQLLGRGRARRRWSQRDRTFRQRRDGEARLRRARIGVSDHGCGPG